MQPLCTLRVRRHRRLTQHSLPGGSLGLTWAGLAPADRASFAWRLPLFDHLVGACEQRDGESEAPSVLAVLRLDLNGLLERQASGFGALEDFTCEERQDKHALTS